MLRRGVAAFGSITGDTETFTCQSLCFCRKQGFLAGAVVVREAKGYVFRPVQYGSLTSGLKGLILRLRVFVK